MNSRWWVLCHGDWGINLLVVLGRNHGCARSHPRSCGRRPRRGSRRGSPLVSSRPECLSNVSGVRCAPTQSPVVGIGLDHVSNLVPVSANVSDHVLDLVLVSVHVSGHCIEAGTRRWILSWSSRPRLCPCSRSRQCPRRWSQHRGRHKTVDPFLASRPRLCPWCSFSSVSTSVATA